MSIPPASVFGHPRVSIGMPVYNGQEFVAEAIRCILQQSYRDLELIISDNGSQDATGEICRRIASTDPRVRYFANVENVGVTENYNRAFAHARGKYFKWASSNDHCAPDLILRCVEALDQRPDAVLCYPRTRLFDVEPAQAVAYDDNLDLQQDDAVCRFERLIDGFHARLNNVVNGVIRVDALRATRLNLPFSGSDYVLVAELILQGKFVEWPEPLFFRRINDRAHSKRQARGELQRQLWPKDAGALRLPSWRLQKEYFSAIQRAPLNHLDKRRLGLVLLRRLNWRRRELIGELVSALR